MNTKPPSTDRVALIEQARDLVLKDHGGLVPAGVPGWVT
jgi:hypothetical protein